MPTCKLGIRNPRMLNQLWVLNAGSTKSIWCEVEFPLKLKFDENSIFNERNYSKFNNSHP
jgi:hypothetical protein